VIVLYIFKCYNYPRRRRRKPKLLEITGVLIFSSNSQKSMSSKMMHISRSCLLTAGESCVSDFAHCTLGASLDGRPHTCRHKACRHSCFAY